MEEVENAFLFIPDMSGFTQLITHSNILHSRTIVRNLLETIIDSNILNLKVAEIQGDSILFYKFGIPPTISELEEQTKKTFLAFQKTLKKIELTDPKVDLHHLTLKFIVHYGPVATMEVKGISKLLGSDIILAHRILKNNLHEHEYILMTSNYLKTQDDQLNSQSFTGSEMKEGKVRYNHFGIVRYKYVSLASLREPIRALSEK
ncbi:MAG: DUF2652 domain-containing protein [Cytophagaceae bacterium]|nr:DUF2652 domain-containing protein [Cytophagaceae bacterium]